MKEKFPLKIKRVNKLGFLFEVKWSNLIKYPEHAFKFVSVIVK